MSLRGGSFLFPTKQSPIMRRLLRQKPRTPRSDIIYERTVPKYETIDLRFALKGCKILEIQTNLFGGINYVSSTNVS